MVAVPPCSELALPRLLLVCGGGAQCVAPVVLSVVALGHSVVCPVGMFSVLSSVVVVVVSALWLRPVSFVLLLLLS